MSTKRVAWTALPILLLLSLWPAWLWWRQQEAPPWVWAEKGTELAQSEAPAPSRAEPELVAAPPRRESPPDDAEPLDPRELDTIFVEQLYRDGGLGARMLALCPWASEAQRRELVRDWVEALTLLRYQHRLAKEAGGMQMALIGAPGDLLFSLMPDLGEEIDAGRAQLIAPEQPIVDPGFGSPTSRFRLEPKHKTLVVEVQTRYGPFDLQLGRDCGEPDLRAALWKESGILWRALLK